MGVWRHKRLLVVFPWPLYSVEEWGTQRDPLALPGVLGVDGSSWSREGVGKP